MSEETNILQTFGAPEQSAAEQTASACCETAAEQSADALDAAQSAPQENAPSNAAEEQPTAPPPTRAQEKKTAFIYLLFALGALACVYIAQIFQLLSPLYHYIYYGNVTTLLISVTQAIFWIPCIVLLYWGVKKCTGYKLFRRTHQELSLKRSMIIYACAIVPIFVVSAVLGFELKVVFELGKRVTGMQLATNAVVYANGAVKLVLAVIMIELVQEAVELLYKGKYAKQIPWGGIALALVFGFLEVIVAYGTHAYTTFAWLYIAFDLLYGVIYVLSKKNFYVTFFVSLIIYIL